MTAVLDNADPAAAAEASPARLASWSARAGAFAIDVLAPAGFIVTATLVAQGTALGKWLWWAVYAGGLVLLVAVAGVNRILLPVLTGWSPGRSVFGIRVVSPAGDAGLGRLLLRDLAHLLDTAALFLGWLWPLWDSRRRTFADLLTRTEVRRVDRPESDVRRRAAALLLTLALLSAIAAGLGYLLVYKQDRAVDEARAQIAEQGPRIVEQMLSYGADSVDADFAKAQSLTTDNYRQQLVAQQDAVRKAGPTTNDYSAVSSAVLPGATADAATMLVALQGQRGTNPQELKFITATVRVEFLKSDGHWLVDNLTVLKRPVLNGGGQ
ncbi:MULTISPECIES: RDD family protein [Mycolicibacterium]|uniref:MCE associated transmembrane protein n=1 Tax=Mycolicibacterium senegalense TaxID=1796 RepID=A0A378W7H1_9MYCO|nr:MULTISPECIES: RDD family protein [Mycolicibacterium]MCV7333446.1 RDD family protein [Mycolicibacterium senegalense]MDR7287672.1 Mce-associated membrane protein [Mycolicibacterium senegalense]QZA24703.1 RDD family protein [Mycolicibacterium senegalense]CDP87010.1 mce associated transmembrane protein [Mycolicibacterium farcinogenes]SUA28749.1 MCE associated transmembrane protein [Mycolicibacterium senegalense]